MPDENSKMDELLKAYAKKRREEAGAPLELHPATRRLLQGEVKRTLAQTLASNEKPRLLWRIWPRLAMGGGILVLLFGLLLWLQPRSSEFASTTPAAQMAQNEKAVLRGADENRTKAESAATPAPVVDAATTASSASRPEQELAGRASKDSVTEFPPSKKERALELRDESRAALAKEKPARQIVPATAAPAEPPQTPAAAPVIASRGELFARKDSVEADKALALKTSGTRMYFSQESPAKRYRQNLLSPPQPAVLTTFHFTQTGDKIQIFDADGSIYEGKILPINGAEKMERVQIEEKQAGAKQSLEQSFTFQASGTNKQHQQVVTVQAEFIVTNLALSTVGGTFALKNEESALAAKKQAKPTSLNSLIQGKVTVGGTNEFSIRAVQTENSPR